MIHDWGSTLGFDWAHQHADRVQGIAYMEAAPLPLTWSDFPDEASRNAFKAFRSEAGEDMVLRDNVFIEAFLIEAEKANLTEADKAVYLRPYLNAGEDRRPMLTWPRQISLDGSPADVTTIVSEFAEWLKHSPVSKLWVRGDPGFITNGRLADFCGGLHNQTEVNVKGLSSKSPADRRLAKLWLILFVVFGLNSRSVVVREFQFHAVKCHQEQELHKK